jgi:YD repeat-containing protein
VTPIVKLPTPLQNRTFQYDAVGNRSASDETANWNYNANHQLLSYGEPASSTSLDYDANGSTIERTITNASGSDTDEYSYDIANRLTELKRNGTSLARYYYDPFGRRLSKEVSGIKTYFLYANEGLVGEYNAAAY